MDIRISGRRTTVTDSQRERVNEKIGGALNVFDISPMTCDVVLKQDPSHKNTKEKSTCEVTVRVRGTVVRVSATKEEMNAAIDEAARLVTRKLRKYKTRVIDRRRTPHGEDLPSVDPNTPLGQTIIDEVEEDDEELVRTKYIEYTKLTEEDALVQADLLGHEFYVFRDMVTDNVHVIYHRKNGGYGIIKPETENPAQ